MTSEISELADRAWKLATAPTIAPSSVYANALRECAEMLRRTSERIAVVQGDLDRESKEAESYHAFWIEERSKRIVAENCLKAERERCAEIVREICVLDSKPAESSDYERAMHEVGTEIRDRIRAPVSSPVTEKSND